jgi:hypothetical protein
MEMDLCCASGDLAGYLKLAQKAPGLPSFEAALLQDKLEDAAQAARTQPHDAVNQPALLYLAAREEKNQKLADEQWQQLLISLGQSSRRHRQLGEMLAGKRPLDGNLVRRLPIDPRQKRVLLVVVARRHPDQARELLPLARSLDFQRDATSLYLRKVLK